MYGQIARRSSSLLPVARSAWRPDVRNLGELAGRLDDASQRDALAALQKARYAGESTHGIGGQLERAFRGGLAWRKPEPKRRDASPLPELYRD